MNLDVLKKRFTITHLLLLIIIAFFTVSYITQTTKMLLIDKKFVDFKHFYSAVKIFNEGGSLHLNYSAFIYSLFTPLTFLPFWTANFVWFLFNNLVIAACMVMSARFTGEHIGSRLMVAAIVVVTFLSSQPILECLALGQINLLILFSLSCIFFLDMRAKKNGILAAILFALVLMAKPQFGLIWLFMLWKRNFTFCVTTIIAYAAYRAAGISLYGLGVEKAYWLSLVDINGFALFHSTINIAPAGVFYRIFQPYGLPAVANIFNYLAAASLTVISFLKIRKNALIDFKIEYAVVISLNLLISPYTHISHLVVMTIPIIIAVCRIRLTPASIVTMVGGFTLISGRLSLAQLPFFQEGFPAVLTGAQSCGVFLIWLVLIRYTSSEDPHYGKALC